MFHRWIRFLLSMLAFSIVLPLFFTCDLGEQPLGPGVSPAESLFQAVPLDSVTRNMRIFAIPANLRANNTDEAEVRVRVYDANHNPLSGKAIHFSASHGIIFSTDTTDSAGEASVIFRSVPINTEAQIIATMHAGDSTQAVATYITLKGVTILISPDYSDALINTQVPVTITLLDGTGLPIPDARMSIEGASDTTGLTKGDGTVKTSVSRTTEGEIKLVVSALGATDSVTLRFWENIDPGTIDTVKTIRRLRIFSSRSQLKANNSDFATITAILTDERNNPLAGDTVLFSCNLGVIDKYGIVDSTGRANVKLTSAPVNGTCVIVAEVKRRDISLRDSISVVFSGIIMELVVEKINLSVNDTGRVDVLLKDGSGNPIGQDQVMFQILGQIGSFQNGSKTFTTKLDPNGRATAWVTSSTAGQVRLRVQGLNMSDTAVISFATNYLSLSSSRSQILVGGIDSCRITATYRDNDNQPVPNVAIVFATNAGTIISDSDITNADGQAFTYLKSSTFAGTATVEALVSDRTAGSATIQVTFAAGQAANITLAITPENIGINGGVASLIATVTDTNGNMVSGANVNFKIEKGPGGGEYIDKPVVTTHNGVARSQLYAGTQPSQPKACEVEASVGAITAKSKMTISGEPHTVTISRPQNDTVFVGKAGSINETTFDYFVGAVVKDVNGNPVADGTKVQFSAVVSGRVVERKLFGGWKGLGSTAHEVKPEFAYSFIDIPFEDLNNNYQMDSGVDLDLDSDPARAARGDDVNGNGIFDYDPSIHDYFFDFNNNGVCDTGVGEPWIIVEGNRIIADLNNNGILDTTELLVDHNSNGQYDGPSSGSGDFPYSAPSSHRLANGLLGWETRKFLPYVEFRNNDFAVVIDASVVTKDGVASTKLTYPRQLARILVVTVNAEANGIRDKDGERFVIPVIRLE